MIQAVILGGLCPIVGFVIGYLGTAIYFLTDRKENRHDRIDDDCFYW